MTDLMYSSTEDQQFFLKCIEGLPVINGFSGDGIDSNGEPMPYGIGPHSVRCLRRIVEIVKPKRILEIGFNVGISSSVWLNLCDASVVSVDISDRKETLTAAEILDARHPGRFKFICSDSAVVGERINYDFDLIFIDGGHLEHHVMADIDLAFALGIPYLAFDDYLPQFGPGVQPAIEKHGLKMIEEMGNIVLMER
jgi:hypothetical protein